MFHSFQIVQRPGEYVVVLPGVFHMGFNVGNNVSEAVNFITVGWVKYGLLYEKCICEE